MVVLADEGRVQPAGQGHVVDGVPGMDAGASRSAVAAAFSARGEHLGRTLPTSAGITA